MPQHSDSPIAPKLAFFLDQHSKSARRASPRRLPKHDKRHPTCRAKHALCRLSPRPLGLLSRWPMSPRREGTARLPQAGTRPLSEAKSASGGSCGCTEAGRAVFHASVFSVSSISGCFVQKNRLCSLRRRCCKGQSSLYSS